jgi:hypothetical protein
VDSLPLREKGSSYLKHLVLLERGGGAHAGFDGLAHDILLARLFERFFDDFALYLFRHDASSNM